MAAAPPSIIGRDAASALGLKHFFTGEPCKHGHVAERIVSSHGCTECDRARALKWRAANLEKARERDRERARKHRAADPERAREKGAGGGPRTWNWRGKGTGKGNACTTPRTRTGSSVSERPSGTLTRKRPGSICACGAPRIRTRSANGKPPSGERGAPDQSLTEPA
jgi:hypothetical protein